MCVMAKKKANPRHDEGVKQNAGTACCPPPRLKNVRGISRDAKKTEKDRKEMQTRQYNMMNGGRGHEQGPDTCMRRENCKRERTNRLRGTAEIPCAVCDGGLAGILDTRVRQQN